MGISFMFIAWLLATSLVNGAYRASKAGKACNASAFVLSLESPGFHPEDVKPEESSHKSVAAGANIGALFVDKCK